MYLVSPSLPAAGAPPPPQREQAYSVSKVSRYNNNNNNDDGLESTSWESWTTCDGVSSSNEECIATATDTDGFVRKLIFENPEAVYVGQINPRTSRPNGEGNYICEELDIRYSGGWANGLREGLGDCHRGEVFYKGSWRFDAMEGKGTLRVGNTIVYEGLFLDGRIGGGRGILTQVSPDTNTPIRSVEGAWSNGWVLSPCKITLHSLGLVYEGDINENGQFHGYGTLSDAALSNVVCRGTWKEGLLEGEDCEFRFADGSFIKGSFRENLPHGNCTFYLHSIHESLESNILYPFAGRWAYGEMVADETSQPTAELGGLLDDVIAFEPLDLSTSAPPFILPNDHRRNIDEVLKRVVSQLIFQRSPRQKSGSATKQGLQYSAEFLSECFPHNITTNGPNNQHFHGQYAFKTKYSARINESNHHSLGGELGGTSVTGDTVSTAVPGCADTYRSRNLTSAATTTGDYEVLPSPLPPPSSSLLPQSSSPHPPPHNLVSAQSGTATTATTTTQTTTPAIQRLSPIPVESTTQIHFTFPKIKAVHRQITYDLCAPRFIDVPVPCDSLDLELREELLQVCQTVDQCFDKGGSGEGTAGDGPSLVDVYKAAKLASAYNEGGCNADVLPQLSSLAKNVTTTDDKWLLMSKKAATASCVRSNNLPGSCAPACWCHQ